jgi:hypothetical protein
MLRLNNSLAPRENTGASGCKAWGFKKSFRLNEIRVIRSANRSFISNVNYVS